MWYSSQCLRENGNTSVFCSRGEAPSLNCRISLIAALALLEKAYLVRDLQHSNSLGSVEYGILRSVVLTKTQCVDAVAVAKMTGSALVVFINSAWWCCWCYSSLQQVTVKHQGVLDHCIQQQITAENCLCIMSTCLQVLLPHCHILPLCGLLFESFYTILLWLLLKRTVTSL